MRYGCLFFSCWWRCKYSSPNLPKVQISPPLLPQTQTGMISTAYLLVSYKRLSLTFADKLKFLSGTNEKILTEMESRTAIDIMRYPALPQLAQFLKRSCGAVTVLEEWNYILRGGGKKRIEGGGQKMGGGIIVPLEWIGPKTVLLRVGGTKMGRALLSSGHISWGKYTLVMRCTQNITL